MNLRDASESLSNYAEYLQLTGQEIKPPAKASQHLRLLLLRQPGRYREQWSGTGPEIAKRRLREDIQVLAGLGRALLACAEIVTNIIGADD